MQADKARRERVRQAMEEYDNTVYYPAMEEARRLCAESGHSSLKFHDNGLGWMFSDCSLCKATVEKRCYLEG